MSIISCQADGVRTLSRHGIGHSRTAAASRASLSCKSVTGAQDGTQAVETQSLQVPEWVPEQANPAFDFLNSTTFDLKQWSVYQQYVAKYVEDPAYQQLVGWKAIPEMINGRLCMLGFTGALFAEVLSGKPVLAQLAAGSPAVFLTSLLVVVGSCVPAVKGSITASICDVDRSPGEPQGVKGDYVEALKDTYTLPKGVFTEAMERVHGRLAMVAMGSMILFETVSGRALL